VKALIKLGADSELLNNKGETALSLAEENNYCEILKVLKSN
jgi:hypothetical protein